MTTPTRYSFFTSRDLGGVDSRRLAKRCIVESQDKNIGGIELRQIQGAATTGFLILGDLWWGTPCGCGDYHYPLPKVQLTGLPRQHLSFPHFDPFIRRL